MKKGLFRKGLVIGIIILFIGASITPSIGGNVVKRHISEDNKTHIRDFNSRGQILYVGGGGEGNYSSIQDAIDNTSNGDTVFVYDDSSPYKENIVVYKSINLIGENRNTTFINGCYSGDVVYISANLTTISGFTIKNIGHGTGIYINSNYSTIAGNNIVDYNYCCPFCYKKGISLRYSENNTIINNKVSVISDEEDSEVTGVHLSYSNNNVIIGNNISDNGGYWGCSWGEGIGIYSSFNNTITENIISNNLFIGINLWYSTKNYISSNHFFSNIYGVYTYWANNNTISDNYFSKNGDGIRLYNSFYTNVINNSFCTDGIFVYDSKYNNVKNNTVNGRPLVYLEDKSDEVITDAGQVILIDCENITVKKLDLSYIDYCVELLGTNNSNICNNNFSYCKVIYSYKSHNNNFSNNNFSYYGIGLYLSTSNGSTICGNTISHGYHSIYISKSSNNIIFHNDFINNTGKAYDDGDNIWDNDYPSGGNFWDDYTGEDSDGDGIGDTPYPIPGGDNEDRYPLMDSQNLKRPVANFTYNVEESPVMFDGSSSYDPDGEIVSYEWDFGDGKTGTGKITYHRYCEVGTYYVTLTVTDDDGIKGSITKCVDIVIANFPPKIEFYGPNRGKPGIEYEFIINVTDPDGDENFIMIDWGDGSFSDWFGPFGSGNPAKISHAWSKRGNYNIRVKFNDFCGESEWSDPFNIDIPRDKDTYRSLLIWLLELFPILERLLTLLK